MNTGKLKRHLATHGCLFSRHGGSHDVWRNSDGSLRTAVPRHREISPGLVRSICRDLGIPPPPEK
jgi:predicted RNA binding protein YcfA (HicA-like mRNA interferase family)